jgi:hypothetical protein
MLNHPCEVMSPQAVEQFQRQALQERASKPVPTAAKPTKRKTRTVKAKANTAKAGAAKVTADKTKRAAGEEVKGDR